MRLVATSVKYLDNGEGLTALSARLQPRLSELARSRV
jgi:hypothetical protein